MLAVGCGDDVSTEGSGTGADQDVGNNTTGDIDEGDVSSTPDVTEADTAAEADGGDDATGDADDATDGGGADTPKPQDCPGGVGCPCEGNNDCDTAVCIDMPGGKKCTSLCTDDCPDGFSCQDVNPGSDPIFACVFKHLTLCTPCMKDTDCKNQGVAALCLDYGAEGRFCGGECSSAADCPQGYSCVDGEGVDGAKAKQCRLDTGVCPCSDWAIKNGAKTLCSLKNDLGTCTAERTCIPGGLSTCDAKPAVAEVCNAADDDCDGITDNLAPDYTCSNKLFADLGSKATCTDDAGCTEKGEKCDAGLCKQLVGECFGKPSCTVGGQLVCNGAKEPKAELCNADDDDCDGATDEDFVWKSPDDKELAIGASCGLGECGGGNVVCSGTKKAVCDSTGQSKDETCNDKDDDCNGTVDDAEKVCDDGDACTDDVCDGKESKCTNPAAVTCDDKNQCTKDSCDAKTGKCVFDDIKGASCDDGNACTEGDLCGTTDGKPACQSGADAKKCDDGNLCTDESCAPDKGCINLPNVATQTCYTGDAKTKGVGECKPGAQYCKDGVLGGACVGQFTPNKNEICDKLDDDCNGVIDNGCLATTVRASFASASGRLKGAKNTLRARLGGESQAGDAKGGKQELKLGFLAWLKSL